MTTARRLSQIFLCCFLVVPIGFALSGLSRYWLEVGTTNALAMLGAAWVLGFGEGLRGSTDQRILAGAAFFLVAAMALVSVFAALGPPPEDPATWLATAREQQARYSLLVFTGLFVMAGFTLLRESLRTKSEHAWSALGFAAFLLSTALFVLYITGFITAVPEALRQRLEAGRTPDWVTLWWRHMAAVDLVEVALAYWGTAAFAASLHKVGWMGRKASRISIGICLLAAPLVLLSQFFPPQFNLGLPIFVFAVPAAPFLIPYAMGVGLLRRLGDRAV